MKAITIFSFLFLFTHLFGQVTTTDQYNRRITADTISGITITYLVDQKELALNFSKQALKTKILKINWEKYSNPKSIMIENYGSNNQIKIKGFKKSRIEDIWFTDTDIEIFDKYNPLPKKLRRFHIIENRQTASDTIIVPKLIEKLKNLM